MLSHDSCILVAASLFVLAILINLFQRSWANKSGLATIFLAFITCLLGQSFFSFIVKKATGHPPLRYPFIIGRLIETGPGADYLRATCPHSYTILCDYVGQFPETMDDFVFSLEPGKGVFAPSFV